MQNTDAGNRFLPLLLRISELMIRRFKLTKVNTFELLKKAILILFFHLHITN